MFKVRKRESKEMATRIIDDVTAPCLRVMLKTRIAYAAKAALNPPTPSPTEPSTTTPTTANTTAATSAAATTAAINSSGDNNDSSRTDDTASTPGHLPTSTSSSTNQHPLTPPTIPTPTTTPSFTTSLWPSDHLNPNTVTDTITRHLDSFENRDLNKATRTQLSNLIIETLTEDIFEIEVEQVLIAYRNLRTFKNNLQNNPYIRAQTKKEVSGNTQNSDHHHQKQQEEEDTFESDSKKDLDAHGDRVYKMMVTRYGTGFETGLTGSLRDLTGEFCCLCVYTCYLA